MLDLNDTDVFTIMHTTRAMRRLKPDPVPDELIRKILEAGVAAPIGANRQTWRFLVVKDPEIKARVQPFYERALDQGVREHYETTLPPGITREQYDRQLTAVVYLTKHFHEAPVWIVPCLPGPNRNAGSFIFPAVQNMLLAARALGLGATLTSRHLTYADEVEAALGLPPDMKSYAIIPIGYPMGRFGPVGRAPASEFVFLDRWGEKYIKDEE